MSSGARAAAVAASATPSDIGGVCLPWSDVDVIVGEMGLHEDEVDMDVLEVEVSIVVHVGVVLEVEVSIVLDEGLYSR